MLTHSQSGAQMPEVTPPVVPDPFGVSVIIPCFNHAASLNRALKSAAGQSRPPTEIIVIDDASSDDSVAVARAFAAQSLVPIKVVALERNGGPARARNAGWAEAVGGLVAFLDADDAWHPRKLEFQVPIFEHDPSLALCGHSFVVEPQEDAPFAEIKSVAFRPFTASELLRRNRFPTPGVMLRRDLRERFRNDQRYGEDYLLWLEIVLGGGRAALMNIPLLRLHKASYGVAGLSARLWEMQRAELKVYIRLQRQGLLGAWAAIHASVWSLVKFARRLMYVKLGLFGGSR
jgi:glycosyltransferase involved in cell wall biosynthesis